MPIIKLAKHVGKNRVLKELLNNKDNTKRKVLKTINMTNGNKLTLEQNKDDLINWYRSNGEVVDANYRFYDPGIKRYREAIVEGRLIDPNKSDYDANNIKYIAATPVSMPNYTKLLDHITQYDNKDIDWGNDDITLRTKGRMNLATIPINMLDSIAINTGRSNTNIKSNLGLIGKESTFGGRSKILEKNYVPQSSFDYHYLTNNHAYFIDPIKDYRAAIDRKLHKDPYNDALRMQLEDDIAYQLKHNGIKNTTKHYAKDIMQDAFMRYADNPAGYNPGQSNYVQMVNNIGNEVWNEPQIQKWWNKQGKHYYEKGLNERNYKRSLDGSVIYFK